MRITHPAGGLSNWGRTFDPINAANAAKSFARSAGNPIRLVGGADHAEAAVGAALDSVPWRTSGK